MQRRVRDDELRPRLPGRAQLHHRLDVRLVDRLVVIAEPPGRARDVELRHRELVGATDLRDRRLARGRAEDHGPSTAPPAVQALSKQAAKEVKEAAGLAWELVTSPIAVAKLLARLRQEHAEAR